MSKQKAKLTIRTSFDLWSKMKHKCIDNRKTVNEYIIGLIKDDLEREKDA